MARFGVVSLGVVLMAVGLGGCALVAEEPAPSEPPPPRSSAKPAIPRPTPRPEARPESPAASGTPAATLSPQALQGLSELELTRRLGRPDQTDTQAMATTWRYRRSGCVLALVLFPEVDGDSKRVLSWEFEKGEPDSCLKRLTVKSKAHAP